MLTSLNFQSQWDQFSIIARFEGSNPDLKNELVIVGAHQDSVNLWLPSFGTAPGADVSNKSWAYATSEVTET
jgi:leucyl aminopeptidase